MVARQTHADTRAPKPMLDVVQKKKGIIVESRRLAQADVPTMEQWEAQSEERAGADNSMKCRLVGVKESELWTHTGRSWKRDDGRSTLSLEVRPSASVDGRGLFTKVAIRAGRKLGRLWGHSMFESNNKPACEQAAADLQSDRVVVVSQCDLHVALCVEGCVFEYANHASEGTDECNMHVTPAGSVIALRDIDAAQELRWFYREDECLWFDMNSMGGEQNGVTENAWGWLQPILDGNLPSEKEWATQVAKCIEEQRVVECTIPGKGVGLMANADIVRGERLMVYGGDVCAYSCIPTTAGSHVLQLGKTGYAVLVVDTEHAKRLAPCARASLANDGEGENNCYISWEKPTPRHSFILGFVPVLTAKRSISKGEELTMPYSSTSYYPETVAY